MNSWKSLNESIVACRRCPRLLEHCQAIGKTKRRAFNDWDYWAKPVPNFGPAKSKLLILGLAPAAHGANRTGRMFTGDRSGDWLYRALHRSGFSNQANAQSVDDGLRLKNCAITAVCHCAPPDNKPTSEEQLNCFEWFEQTWSLTRPKVCVALGGIAWNQLFKFAKRIELYSKARPKFGHGAEVTLLDGTVAIGSYHPSQQNTFTGRLTEEMLDEIFERVKRIVESPNPNGS